MNIRYHQLRGFLARLSVIARGALFAWMLSVYWSVAIGQSAGIDALEFIETFESGTLGDLGVSGNSPVATRESSRGGNWSMKSYLNRLSTENNFRTEARIRGTQNIGDEYWLGFSIRPSADWKPDSVAEGVVFQAHDSVFPSNKNPMFSLRAMPNGQWRVVGRYISVENGSKSDQKTAFTKDLGQVVAGKWTDFVIHYRWAYDHGQGGFTKIWLDGNLVLDHQGPNCYNDPTGPFWKFGIYAALWGPKFDFEHTVDEWTFYHDEIRIADARGSFEAVAPPSDLAPPKSPTADVE